MTIKVQFLIDGKKFVDTTQAENASLAEVSFAIYWLEFLKQDLLKQEFEPDFSIKKDDKDE